MDSIVVKNAIGGLDKLLSQARRALWEVGREIFVGYDEDDDRGSYADPRAALGATLEELHDILLVVLEAAQMPECRAALVTAWPEFVSPKDGLRHIDEDGEYQSCASPGFTFLERLIKALRMTVSQQITSEQAWTLTRLEAMLEDTAGLASRHREPPANEIELQKIMHDYLSACFPDFRNDPRIGGTIKNFDPDCGIASVAAAIEFKLAHTKQQAKVNFTGVVEDTGGYKGSKDWTRFYAVMYQAKHFILKSQLESEMKRIGAATWRAILVTGETKPKPRRKAAAAKKQP
jgi:hypothetical protein